MQHESGDTAHQIGDDLLLSNKERQLLELYDRLKEVKLEVAYLKSLASQDVGNVTFDEEELRNAQDELLEAKALYQLREDIEQRVLIANPILKAVHSGDNASPVERDNLPLLAARDTTSIQLALTTTRSNTLQTDLTTLKIRHATLTQQNVDLAATMMSLAREVESVRKQDIQDPKVRNRVAALEGEVEVSRRKWMLMKGVVGGVVVGSGVDWARNEGWRELVLDEEDDDF